MPVLTLVVLQDRIGPVFDRSLHVSFTSTWGVVTPHVHQWPRLVRLRNHVGRGWHAYCTLLGEWCPHKKINCYDFFGWTYSLIIDDVFIALQREWRPSGGELAVLAHLCELATSTSVAPSPPPMASPWAILRLGT